MPKTSTPTLTERIQRRNEEERQRRDAAAAELTEVAARQVEEIGKRLDASANAALQHFASATRTRYENHLRHLRSRVLVYLLTGLTICAGIWLPTWAIGRWLSAQVENEIAVLVAVRSEIEREQQTLAVLETHGLELLDREDGAYLILPAGLTVETLNNGRKIVRFPE